MAWGRDNTQPEQPTIQNEGRSTSAKTWTFVASGGFLFLILLAGVVIALAPSKGGPVTAAPTQQPQPAPTTSSAPGDQPTGNQTPPTSPPTGVQWQLYQSVALPYSATDGPHTVAGPVASGYARNPVGALLATTQIATRKLVSPGQEWRQVVDQQVVAGPGRDAFIAARAQVTDTSGADPRLGQFAGFRFVTYTPDLAVIQIATRFTSGGLQVTTNTVQFSGGDWKQVLQPDGSDSPTVQSIPDLTGFVAWSGV